MAEMTKPPELSILQPTDSRPVFYNIQDTSENAHPGT